MAISEQTKMLEITAESENQKTARTSGWIAWIANYIGNTKDQGDIVIKEDPITGENAKKVIENTIVSYEGEEVGRHSVDRSTDEEMCSETKSDTSISIDKNKDNSPKQCIQSIDFEKETKIIAELRMDNFIMANELSLARDMHYVIEHKMKSMKDNYVVQIKNERAKHDRSVQQMKDDFMKTMANRINDDKSKKEDDLFIKKELCTLRDNFYQMEQKMRRIDDSVISQNQKYIKSIEKLQVNPDVVTKISTTSYSEQHTDYKKLNHQMEKLVDSLKSEKQILLTTIEKMAKEIKSINRNNNLKKKDFNKFKSQMTRDINDMKKFLYSLENTASKAKTDNIDRRKYDKLKMRLSMIERAEVANQIKVEQMRLNMTVVPSGYIRAGGMNDSIANVQYEAKPKQEHSVIPSPLPAPPAASPKVPTPPPFGPPPTSSKSPEPQSGPPRYAINNDILKAMSSELRKPDGNNIRRIPRRSDMKIPSRAQNKSEQEGPSPQTVATVPAIAPKAMAGSSEQPIFEDLESTDIVSLIKVSEVVVGPETAVEPPASDELPSSEIVDSVSYRAGSTIKKLINHLTFGYSFDESRTLTK